MIDAPEKIPPLPATPPPPRGEDVTLLKARAVYEVAHEALNSQSAVMLEKRVNGKVPEDQFFVVDQDPLKHGVTVGVTDTNGALQDNSVFTVRFGRSTENESVLRATMVQSDHKQNSTPPYSLDLKNMAYMEKTTFPFIQQALPNTDQGRYIAENIIEAYATYIVRNKDGSYEAGTISTLNYNDIPQEQRIGSITVIKYKTPDGKEAFACMGNSFAVQDKEPKPKERMKMAFVENAKQKADSKQIIETPASLAAATELVATNKANELLELIKGYRNYEVQLYFTQGVTSNNPEKRAEVAKVIRAILEKKEEPDQEIEIAMAKRNLFDELNKVLPIDQKDKDTIQFGRNLVRLLEEHKDLFDYLVDLSTQPSMGSYADELTRGASSQFLFHANLYHPKKSLLLREDVIQKQAAFLNQEPNVTKESLIDDTNAYACFTLRKADHLRIVGDETESAPVRSAVANQLPVLEKPLLFLMSHSVDYAAESIQMTQGRNRIEAVSILYRLSQRVYSGHEQSYPIFAQRLSESTEMQNALADCFTDPVVDNRCFYASTLLENLTSHEDTRAIVASIIGKNTKLKDSLIGLLSFNRIDIQPQQSFATLERSRISGANIFETLYQDPGSREALSQSVSTDDIANAINTYAQHRQSKEYNEHINKMLQDKSPNVRAAAYHTPPQVTEALSRLVKTWGLETKVGPLDSHLLTHVEKGKNYTAARGNHYVGINEGNVYTDNDQKDIVYVHENRNQLNIRSGSNCHVDTIATDQTRVNPDGDLFIGQIVQGIKPKVVIDPGKKGRVFVHYDFDLQNVEVENRDWIYKDRVFKEGLPPKQSNSINGVYVITHNNEIFYLVEAESQGNEKKRVLTAYKREFVHLPGEAPQEKMIFLRAQDPENKDAFNAWAGKTMGASEVNEIIAKTGLEQQVGAYQGSEADILKAACLSLHPSEPVFKTLHAIVSELSDPLQIAKAYVEARQAYLNQYDSHKVKYHDATVQGYVDFTNYALLTNKHINLKDKYYQYTPIATHTASPIERVDFAFQAITHNFAADNLLIALQESQGIQRTISLDEALAIPQNKEMFDKLVKLYEEVFAPEKEEAYVKAEAEMAKSREKKTLQEVSTTIGKRLYAFYESARTNSDKPQEIKTANALISNAALLFKKLSTDITELDFSALTPDTIAKLLTVCIGAPVSFETENNIPVIKIHAEGTEGKTTHINGEYGHLIDPHHSESETDAPVWNLVFDNPDSEGAMDITTPSFSHIARTNNVDIKSGSVDRIDKAQDHLGIDESRVGTIGSVYTLHAKYGAFDQIGNIEHVTVRGDQNYPGSKVGTIEYGEIVHGTHVTLQEGAKVIVGDAEKVIFGKELHGERHQNTVLIIGSNPPSTIESAENEALLFVTGDFLKTKQRILDARGKSTVSVETFDALTAHLPQKEGDITLVTFGGKTYTVLRTKAYNADRKDYNDTGYAFIEVVQRNDAQYLFLRDQLTIPAEAPQKLNEAQLKQLFPGQTITTRYETVKQADGTQKEILVLEKPAEEGQNKPLLIGTPDQYAWLQKHPHLKLAGSVIFSAHEAQPQSIVLDSLDIQDEAHINVLDGNINIQINHLSGKGNIRVAGAIENSSFEFNDSTLSIGNKNNVAVKGGSLIFINSSDTGNITLDGTSIEGALLGKGQFALRNCKFPFRQWQDIVNLEKKGLILLPGSITFVDKTISIRVPLTLKEQDELKTNLVIQDFTDFENRINAASAEAGEQIYIADIGGRMYEAVQSDKLRGMKPESLQALTDRMKQYTGRGNELNEFTRDDFENLTQEQMEGLLALCLTSEEHNKQYIRVQLEQNKAVLYIDISPEKKKMGEKIFLGIPDYTSTILGAGDEKVTIKLKGADTQFHISGTIKHLETEGVENSWLKIHTKASVDTIIDLNEGEHLVIMLQGSIGSLNAAKIVELDTFSTSSPPTIESAGKITKLIEIEHENRAPARIGYVQEITDAQLTNAVIIASTIQNLYIRENGTANVLIWNKNASGNTNYWPNTVKFPQTAKVMAATGENTSFSPYQTDAGTNTILQVVVFENNGLDKKHVELVHVIEPHEGQPNQTIQLLESIRIPDNPRQQVVIDANNSLQIVEQVPQNEVDLISFVQDAIKFNPKLKRKIADIIGIPQNDVPQFLEQAKIDPTKTETLFEKIIIRKKVENIPFNPPFAIVEELKGNEFIFINYSAYFHDCTNQIVKFHGDANCILDNVTADRGSITLEGRTHTTINNVWVTENTRNSNDPVIRINENAVATIHGFQGNKIEFGEGSAALFLDATLKPTKLSASKPVGSLVILGPFAQHSGMVTREKFNNVFHLPNNLRIGSLFANEVKSNAPLPIVLDSLFPQAFEIDGRKLVFMAVPHETNPRRKAYSLFEVTNNGVEDRLELICATENKDMFKYGVRDGGFELRDQTEKRAIPDIKRMLTAAFYQFQDRLNDEQHDEYAKKIAVAFEETMKVQPKLSIEAMEKATEIVMLNHQQIVDFRKRIASPTAVDTINLVMPHLSRDEDIKRFSRIKSVVKSVSGSEIKAMEKKQAEQYINEVAAALTPIVFEPERELASGQLAAKLSMIRVIDSMLVTDSS